MAEEIMGDVPIEPREDHLRVVASVAGIEMRGTMDACQKIEGRTESVVFFDLKSGMVRDYKLQMAAYALGL